MWVVPLHAPQPDAGSRFPSFLPAGSNLICTIIPRKSPARNMAGEGAMMMKAAIWSRAVAVAVLVAAAACTSGPPALNDLKVGKDKDVTQAANSFGPREQIFATVGVDNPPKDGKVVGRFVVVDVPGQQAGPIPSLETSLSLAGGLNKASFNYSAPDAGWPNGKYKLEVELFDATGASKGKKSTDFTTAGNAPAAAPAAVTATSDATSTDAATTTGADAPAASSTSQQQ
jgi:hypothetical protein